MRIKVDEDLPTAAVQMLRRNGHQTVSVVGQGMGGTKDSGLWQAIQTERRFLVTADKGFGDIRRYPPGTHGGILLLRPDQAGIRPVLDLLERVLTAHDLEAMVGTIAVVTPRGVRIRRIRSEI